MGVADDFAVVASRQSSFSDAAGTGHALPKPTAPRSIAERAELPIELLSRWAGILAFCGALGLIAWLIV